jgi:hypothetical protein
MGCFGYICKHCGTSIRGDCFTGGEKAVLTHVRHGKEVGRVEGHYDDKPLGYRSDAVGHINSHTEICNSEFGLRDSYMSQEGRRLYEGNPVTYWELKYALMTKMLKDGQVVSSMGPFDKQVEDLFLSLPIVPSDKTIFSGTVAYHSVCYRKAMKTGTFNLIPSESDPQQSWGKVRKKFK